MNYKLGSLFDGSGGFPLSGTLCDIEPIWAAEIEPYPIAVTSSRFPNMKHLGDISKVNGAEIEPVDIITFGSPCQDLSVAGKRAGLKHEDNGDDETTRSGLFMEAVRIIKEMRNATNGQYPRFAVWENVPGAFSSNNGEDFRVVLQELIKITEPNAVMPEVPKNGWAYADSYCGDGWSLAYRVFDAQFWGVPQRRRRIYLVADFGGGCAEKILFKRKGLRGYFTKSGTQGQTVTPNVERSVGTDDCERTSCGIDGYNGDITGDKSATLGVNCGMSTGRNGVAIAFEPGASRRLGGYAWEDVAGTLRANMGDNQTAVAYGVDAYNQVLTGDKAKTLNSAASDSDHVPCTVYSVENHPADSRVNLDESGRVQTLTSRMGTGGGNVPMVMEPVGVDCYNLCTTGDVGRTVTTASGGLNEHIPVVMEEVPKVINLNKDDVQSKTILDPGASRDVGALFIEECGKTLAPGTCPGHHDGVVIARPIHSMTTGSYMQVNNELAPTLAARDYKDPTCVEFFDARERRYIVRRLTPTECARLQGFPDKWGHLEPKTELTDDEYRFWLNVRRTHDGINGRAVKDYNEKQMLTYYNKLWTDSAEYKMWGNGIALPCALYVLHGIKDALVEEQTARSKWLDELLGGL